MQFIEYPAFLREYARLHKRFLSLDADIEKIKRLLARCPEGTGGKNWNALYRTERIIVFKTRLACMYLRKNALRLVYAYLPGDKSIVLIELYFKGDKENEDRERIKNYLASF